LGFYIKKELIASRLIITHTRGAEGNLLWILEAPSLIALLVVIWYGNRLITTLTNKYLPDDIIWQLHTISLVPRIAI
jgi:hypothetical protein